MLHDLSYYYQKVQDSGVRDLNYKVTISHTNWVTNEVRSWPEVKTYFDFIDKCYSIASVVPLYEILGEFYIAKFSSKKALVEVQLKVVYWMNYLNDKDIEHKMGFTPIFHMREQLVSLWESIEKEISNAPSVVVHHPSPFFKKLSAYFSF